MTREFLDVYRALLRGETVNTNGKHITIEDGRLLFPPHQPGGPPLYFGGSSDAGIDVAVDTVDKYLTWGEPPAQVAEKIERVSAVAAQRGRKVSFGIRLHVIVRETNEEAWKAADDLISHVTDETVASAQQIFARMDSVGQQRMAKLHGGRRDKLEISPNLWAGVGLVRGGAGTALVGDPQTVAARIKEYQVARHRYLHHVRLSASGGSLPLRRTGVSASRAPQPPTTLRRSASTPARSARPSPTNTVPSTSRHRNHESHRSPSACPQPSVCRSRTRSSPGSCR